MQEQIENLDLVKELSKDRIILLFGDFDDDMAADVVALLLFLNSKDKEKEITIYINSVGGDVNCLLAIYDCIQMIEAPVKTVCLGSAYSAGAVILACGSPGLRYASENSHIMIHQIQIGEIASGSGTELEIEAKVIKQTKERLNTLLARHTGQYLTKVKRDCEHDKYMTAEEAKEYGLIDHIIKANKVVPELRKKASGRKKES